MDDALDSLEKALVDSYDEIEVLKAQILELEHSQIKKENKLLRQSILETNKELVDARNEILELRRKHGCYCQ